MPQVVIDDYFAMGIVCASRFACPAEPNWRVLMTRLSPFAGSAGPSGNPRFPRLHQFLPPEDPPFSKDFRSMRLWTPGFRIPTTLLMGILLAGCTDPDPIRQYTVAKPTPTDTSIASPSSTPQQQRTEAWFFKLMGPDAAVVAQAETFTQLVRSIEFGPDSKPKWTLPEGWTERTESGIRFATITVPGTPPLEVSVVSLPAPNPISTDYLFDNFNRWRKQVGLPELEKPEELETSREKHELVQVEARGRKVTLANLAGKTEAGVDSRMLVAMLPGKPSSELSAASPAPPSTSDSSKPFTYTLPAGWKDAPLRTFQLAAFTAEQAGETLAISIATAGGDLTGNVNRWRGQTGLPPQSEQEIADAAKPIEVSGVAAKYFIVEGESRSILGVIAPRDGAQWFIKADGPKALAAKERENFEAFVKSLKFK